MSCHFVLWLVIVSSVYSQYPLIGHHILWFQFLSITFSESVTDRPTWAILHILFLSHTKYIQSLFYHISRFRIPNVDERLKRDSEGRTFSSNLVFTIWAVFGGFILHFLLCNYLTVLLTPSYEEPVETAKDLIKRDITPVLWPGGEIWRQFFAASSDPNYQEISQRFVIAEDWDEYEDLVRKVTSTGMYADIGIRPWIFNFDNPEEDFKNWYRSTETISGKFPYPVHLTNKKWPLKKVLLSLFVIVKIIFLLFTFRNMILIFSD